MKPTVSKTWAETLLFVAQEPPCQAFFHFREISSFEQRPQGSMASKFATRSGEVAPADFVVDLAVQPSLDRLSFLPSRDSVTSGLPRCCLSRQRFGRDGRWASRRPAPESSPEFRRNSHRCCQHNTELTVVDSRLGALCRVRFRRERAIASERKQTAVPNFDGLFSPFVG